MADAPLDVKYGRCYFSKMIHKGQIVGFVRKHVRHSLPSQRDAMAHHGITKVYDDLALCVRQRRKGAADVIAVKRLQLLADPAHRRKLGGMRQSLYAALDAIETAGASVWELDTDRRTLDQRQRDLMLREAIDTMSRARPSARPPGRPQKVWTPEQQTIMRLHWHSTKHATDDAAVAAIRADGVPAAKRQVHRVLGPSGRRGGSKRKLK